MDGWTDAPTHARARTHARTHAGRQAGRQAGAHARRHAGRQAGRHNSTQLKDANAMRVKDASHRCIGRRQSAAHQPKLDTQTRGMVPTALKR
eukprot:368649-Alexandrium_andersonii.AAC.1